MGRDPYASFSSKVDDPYAEIATVETDPYADIATPDADQSPPLPAQSREEQTSLLDRFNSIGRELRRQFSPFTELEPVRDDPGLQDDLIRQIDREATETLGRQLQGIGGFVRRTLEGGEDETAQIRRQAQELAESDDPATAAANRAFLKFGEYVDKIGTLIGEAFGELERGSEATRRAQEFINPVDQDFRESLAGQITGGVAQTLVNLPTYAVLPVGVSLTAGDFYQQGADDAERALIERINAGEDIDPQEAQLTIHRAGLQNVPGAAFEVLGDKLIIGRVLKPMKGKISVGGILRQLGAAGLSEGATEGAQQVWLNFVANTLSAYDPERTLDDEVINSILVGGAVGVLTGGAGGVLSQVVSGDAEATARLDNAAANVADALENVEDSRSAPPTLEGAAEAATEVGTFDEMVELQEEIGQEGERQASESARVQAQLTQARAELAAAAEENAATEEPTIAERAADEVEATPTASFAGVNPAFSEQEIAQRAEQLREQGRDDAAIEAQVARMRNLQGVELYNLNQETLDPSTGEILPAGTTVSRSALQRLGITPPTTIETTEVADATEARSFEQGSTAERAQDDPGGEAEGPGGRRGLPQRREIAEAQAVKATEAAPESPILQPLPPAPTATAQTLLAQITAQNPAADAEATRQLLGNEEYVLQEVSLTEVGRSFGTPTQTLVEQYAEQDAQTLPPVVLNRVDGQGQLRPVDGKHRVAAARLRGDTTIRAYVPRSEVQTAEAAEVETSQPLPPESLITIQRPLVPGAPGAVQIDLIDTTAEGGARNVESTNPASLRERGIEVPFIPDDIPQGQYTAAEMRDLVNQRRAAGDDMRQLPYEDNGTFREDRPPPQPPPPVQPPAPPPVQTEEEATSQAKRRRAQVFGRKDVGQEYTPAQMRQTRDRIQNQWFDATPPVSPERTEQAWALIQDWGSPATGYATAQDVFNIGQNELAYGIAQQELFNYALKLAGEGDAQMVETLVKRINLMPTPNAAGGVSSVGRTLAGRSDFSNPAWLAQKVVAAQRDEVSDDAVGGAKTAEDLQAAIDNANATPDELIDVLSKIRLPDGRTVLEAVSPEVTDLDQNPQEVIRFIAQAARRRGGLRVLPYRQQQVGALETILKQFPLAAWRDMLATRGGKGLEQSWWKLLSGPTQAEVGPISAMDRALQSELGAILRQALVDMGLVKTNAQPPADADRLAMILGEGQTRRERLEVADQRVRAAIEERLEDDIENGVDPDVAEERATLLLQAWDAASSQMATRAAGPALMRRMLVQELKRLIGTRLPTGKTAVRWQEWFRRSTDDDIRTLRQEVLKGLRGQIAAVEGRAPSNPIDPDLLRQAMGQFGALFDGLVDEQQAKFLASEAARVSGVIERGEEGVGLSILIDAIQNTPLLRRLDPAWRENAAIDWLRTQTGLSDRDARTIAQTLVRRIDAVWAAARERAATKALQASTAWKRRESQRPKKAKSDLDRIMAAVRAELTDPAAGWRSAIARENGWSGFTAEQHQRLAELDVVIADENSDPHQRAKAQSEVMDIVRRAKIPPGLGDLVSDSYVASMFSGMPTMTINFFAPAFQMVRNLYSELVTNPLNAGRTWSNFRQAMRSFAPEFRWAWMNDAYTFQRVEYLNNAGALQRAMEEGWNKMRRGKPTGIPQFLVGAQNFVYRTIGALDQAWRVAERQYKSALYASRAMKEAGWKRKDIDRLVESIGAVRRQTYEDALAAGYSDLDARVRANDAVLDEIYSGVSREAGDVAAELVQEAARKDADALVGMRSPGIHETDEGMISRVLFINDLMSAFTRALTSPNPATRLGARFMFGVVNVPLRVLRFNANYSPYGLVRWTVNRVRRGQRKESWWNQTYSNHLQERQRLREALSGTAVMLLLPAFAARSADDDPEEDNFAIYVTGAGPDASDPIVRDAWLKRFSPFSFTVKLGRGRYLKIPLSRAGEAVIWPVALTGAIDDFAWKRKQTTGRRRPREISEFGEVAGNYFASLGQRGVFSSFRRLGDLSGSTTGEQALSGAVRSGIYSARPLIPWSGTMGSMTRVFTDPIDSRTLEGAALANLPIIGPILGKPALNAYGDPIQDRSISGRLIREGVPIVLQVDDPENVVYRLTLDKGQGPSTPRRSQVEQTYGPLTAEQWYQYTRDYGQYMKQFVELNADELAPMNPFTFNETLNRVQRHAREDAATKTGLDADNPPVMIDTARSLFEQAQELPLDRWQAFIANEQREGRVPMVNGQPHPAFVREWNRLMRTELSEEQ